MTETARLRLPEIAAAQAQKHVTHNEALVGLDTLVQVSVRDKDLTAPPGSPAEGDCYIVAASATGAWTGWDGRIARYEDGAWRAFLPGAGAGEGWRAWVEDEAALYVLAGGAWRPLIGGAVPWTPAIAPATPGTWDVSYGDRYGVAVRIGPLVWVQFHLTFTPTVGTGSGNLAIGPLPWGSVDPGGVSVAFWSGVVTRFNNNWAFPAGSTQWVVRVDVGTNTLGLAANTLGGGTNAITAAHLTNAAQHIIVGNAVYLAG